MPWSKEGQMRELIQRKRTTRNMRKTFIWESGVQKWANLKGLRSFSQHKGELENQSGPSSIPTL